MLQPLKLVAASRPIDWTSLATSRAVVAALSDGSVCVEISLGDDTGPDHRAGESFFGSRRESIDPASGLFQAATK